MLSQIMNSDPYENFTQWCLKNGFSDVVHCNSKEVDLRRLGLAINQYVSPKAGAQKMPASDTAVFSPGVFHPQS